MVRSRDFFYKGDGKRMDGKKVQLDQSYCGGRSFHCRNWNQEGAIHKILAEMLKFSKDVMLEFCTKFFNKFSVDGTSQAEWCKAIVVLIHKGDTNRVDNYRMVSLQSVRSEFYASIVHSSLYFYVKCHCWKIKRGGQAFTQFVDIEKSFDSVQFILTSYP